jgi:hypothetical protein
MVWMFARAVFSKSWASKHQIEPTGCHSSEGGNPSRKLGGMKGVNSRLRGNDNSTKSWASKQQIEPARCHPREAGIHSENWEEQKAWIPAFAGMTTLRNHGQVNIKSNLQDVIPAKAGIHSVN